MLPSVVGGGYVIGSLDDPTVIVPPAGVGLTRFIKDCPASKTTSMWVETATPVNHQKGWLFCDPERGEPLLTTASLMLVGISVPLSNLTGSAQMEINLSYRIEFKGPRPPPPDAVPVTIPTGATIGAQNAAQGYVVLSNYGPIANAPALQRLWDNARATAQKLIAIDPPLALAGGRIAVCAASTMSGNNPCFSLFASIASAKQALSANPNSDGDVKGWTATTTTIPITFWPF